jgi:hypothetical protein
MLEDFRNDMVYVSNLSDILYKKLEELSRYEAKNWMYDVFLDKIYESHAKIAKFLHDMDADYLLGALADKLNAVRTFANAILSEPFESYDFDIRARGLNTAISNYAHEVEWAMSSLRLVMHQVSWEGMKKIKTEDYMVVKKRVRFVRARDELEHAKQAIKNGKWDDVLNHLRPAIDLAIKEKFGFQKINPMKQFLNDADRYSLPLPSYTMLYDYFDEGSHRIHGGRINTPWECQKALSFVAEFIDRLELIDVSQKKIEEFKKKCNAVS